MTSLNTKIRHKYGYREDTASKYVSFRNVKRAIRPIWINKRYTAPTKREH